MEGSSGVLEELWLHRTFCEDLEWGLPPRTSMLPTPQCEAKLFAGVEETVYMKLSLPNIGPLPSTFAQSLRIYRDVDLLLKGFA